MSYFKYSADKDADYRVSGLMLKNGVQTFDLHHPGGTISGIRLQSPGKFNLENAVGAMAAGLKAGISPEKIKEAIETYEGVVRRFEFVFKGNKTVYIDDYAHHPEELKACITTARDLYPGRRITGVFQPHLYSRTRDLAEGFAESLDLLDEAFLLDIYPARELPIPGVTTEIILERMTLSSKQLIDRENLLAHLRNNPPEVFITMGAGDIDQLVSPISAILQNSSR
jgi:UDP-N-acetylmuramate--alanine ligase